MKMCDISVIKLILVGLFLTLALSDSIKNVTNQMDSSIILPLTGNFHPIGHYSTTIGIGNPPLQYVFDVDTGSDITWLQCDAPCKHCFPSPNRRYKPKKEDTVKCKDPFCTLPQPPGKKPEEPCEYKVEYLDDTSSSGFLLRDSYTFQLNNGKTVAHRLGIGCGDDQQWKDEPPYTDGVLGIGNGKLSIVAQLHNLGQIRNVFGHCLSAQGNGYLSMGINVLPSGIVWAPIRSKEQYTVGPAEFLYDGQSTHVRGLPLVFDSGTTFTFFISPAYDALLNQLTKTMTQNKFVRVGDLRDFLCWKGPKTYTSISEVKNLFKTLTLSFTQLKNVQFQMSPEAYLFVSASENVCLGIQKNEIEELKDLNIIGDISMLDKLIIYNNEKLQLGWVAADCNKRSMS